MRRPPRRARGQHCWAFEASIIADSAIAVAEAKVGRIAKLLKCRYFRRSVHEMALDFRSAHL